MRTAYQMGYVARMRQSHKTFAVTRNPCFGADRARFSSGWLDASQALQAKRSFAALAI